MRIIAGQFKGRTIKTISPSSYRPTQSRIRKSLFDILGSLNGKSFLDLYSGSGIVGFESASRGATKITFIENDSTSFKLLHENAQQFEKNMFTIKKKNALKFLKTSDVFDVIFADPPYNSNELPELVKLGCEHITDTGIFILESRTGIELKNVSDKRIYGDTQLNFWKS